MSIHKAAPAHGDEFARVSGTIIDDCAVCAETVKRVPGGSGPTWVHAATGAVAGTDPVVEAPNIVDDSDHPCRVCGAPGARDYCPDCGSEQVDL